MKMNKIKKKQTDAKRPRFKKATRLFAYALSLNIAVAPAFAVLPLKTMGVPDVNVLGLLDGSGTGYSNNDWGEPITQQNKQTALQQFGKAAFYDMQVGSDGITACASCHFTSGADNRTTNQMSPGLRRTAGGINDIASFTEDFTHQLGVGPNGTLTQADYGGAASNRGFPVDETAVLGVNGGAVDDPLTGAPAVLPDPATVPASDVNEVASSQGPRAIAFEGLHCKDGSSAPADCDTATATAFPSASEGNGISPGRQDLGTLDTSDPGFEVDFTANASGIPDTARHVEPRNTQSVYNTIFNQRSFFDGRADIFYNGVNTLGFRDPDARVRVYTATEAASPGDSISLERMNVPFSSLASQAMGPIESVLEMVGHLNDGSGRPNHFLGKKMVNATPLFNQQVSCTDSLLGGLTDCTTDGANRGLSITYPTYRHFITDIFSQRFWGDGNGNDICLDADDDFTTIVDMANCSGTGTEDRTLMELNFAMFFALAIQAYEATLVTDNTIVDLLSGGVIPLGTEITNTNRNSTVTVDLGAPFPANGNRPGGLANVGLNLDECIELVALNNSAAQEAIATELCTLKFAEFIHGKATAGSQAGLGPNQPAGGALQEGDAIGGCNGDPDNPLCQAAQASLLNIWEGLGRFQAGSTGCTVCHFDPTFTGATVAATTGFGAPPPEPFIPAGQLRREEAPALTERMIKFDGAPAVYDAGFYNLAVRPTAEDLGVGWREGGVPLSFSKLKEQLAILAGGGSVDGAFDQAKITGIANTLTGTTGPGALQLPTSMAVNGLGTTNLAPVPFALTLACGPGLNGNGNGQGEPNNNPNVNCVPDVIPGEFILRNGAHKTPNLRNGKYTGPYFHTGSKMNLHQVFSFYKGIGALAPATSLGFPNMNLANLDAGLRVIALDPAREAAVIELMETGLTAWDAAHEQGKFDHPELCVPIGHDPATGHTILAGIPAVGAAGNTEPLATFEEVMVGGTGHEHDFTDPCTIPGLVTNTTLPQQPSLIDVPPTPPSP